MRGHFVFQNTVSAAIFFTNKSNFIKLIILERGKEKPVSDPTLIVLAGGPSSGKTSVINRLRARFVPPKDTGRERDHRVMFFPEMATMWLDICNVLPPGERPDNVQHLVAFQRAIYGGYARLHEYVLSLARVTGARVVILDRGAPDGLAYLLDHGGRELFERDVMSGGSLEDAFALYHHVFLLESMARGRPDEYRVELGNEVRMEGTLEVAAELDRRIWKVWQMHRSVTKLHCHDDIDYKPRMVLDFVENLLDA